MSKRLSVLIAVHNTAKYLPRLINSLASNYVEGIEYVFVDDGSKDESYQELMINLEGEDILADSTVLRNVTSLGIGAVRQQLLDTARAEYFIYADSDDYIDDGMFAGLLKGAEESGADITWEDYFVDTHSSVRTSQSCTETAEAFFVGLCKGVVHGGVCNKLMRRSTLLSMGISFLPDVNCCEDFYILARLALSGCKVHYLPASHYHYVQHGSSITHRGGVIMAKNIWNVALSLDSHVPDRLNYAWNIWKDKKCCDIVLDDLVSDADAECLFSGIRSVKAEDVGLLKCVLFYMARHGQRPIIRMFKRLFRRVRFLARGY